MYVKFPKEVQEWINMYKPYFKDGHFIEGTPQEAVDAYEKAKKWALEQGQS